MKKALIVLVIAMFCLTLFPVVSQAKVDRQPGGLVAFIVGCCWGIREGSEWNEGADMHWREWLLIVPIAGLIIGIWNGIDCYNGMTAHDWAQKNGANWY